MLDLIRSELRKVAFFLQHSGLFEQFPARMRNALENLPIEWDKVDVGGEFEPGWGVKEKRWKEATLLGKLNNDEIKIIILKDQDRYEYQIYFLKKLYKVNNLVKLQSTINSIHKGEKSKPQVMQEFYDLLFTQKTDLHRYTQNNFLSQASPTHWFLDIKRDVGHIYLRFYVKEEETQKELIEAKLKEHNSYRMESIIHYLKSLAKRAGLDIGKLDFNNKFITLPHQIGVIFTIK